MAKAGGDRPGTWTRERGVIMNTAQMRASLAAAALLLLAGLHTLEDFLPSLVWAVIFAFGLWPHLTRLGARWPAGRKTLLPAGAVVAVVVVFVVPLTVVTVPLVQDAHSLAQWVEQARLKGIPAPPVLAELPYGAKLTDLWRANLGQPGQISELASRALQGGVVRTGRRVGAEALHRVVQLGFMLLVLFFLLREGDRVVEQVRVASRRAFGPAGEDVGRQVVLSIHGTINGLVLVGLVEGLILGVAYFVARTPHAALFGLMTALLAMVPFGAAVAFVLAGAALAATGKVVAAVVIVALGSLVTFTADHFFRPVLIGGATQLPFVWVLLGILGGVEAWGLVGLFLGPALLAALILLWREWVGSQQGPINPLPVDV